MVVFFSLLVIQFYAEQQQQKETKNNMKIEEYDNQIVHTVLWAHWNADTPFNDWEKKKTCRRQTNLLAVLLVLSFSQISETINKLFMHKEYKTNPISVILRLIWFQTYRNIVYKICSRILRSSFFSSLSPFNFFPTWAFVIRHVQQATDYYVRKCTCPFHIDMWMRRERKKRANHLPVSFSFGRWILSIRGILNGSACFQLWIHNLLLCEWNLLENKVPLCPKKKEMGDFNKKSPKFE